jgi:hypothetical protein
MIFERRGRWCFVDDKGHTHKFTTEAEAKAAYGIEDATKEESFEEETRTDEQETVFESEVGSEEEIQGVPVSVRKWMASKDL